VHTLHQSAPLCTLRRLRAVLTHDLGARGNACPTTASKPLPLNGLQSAVGSLQSAVCISHAHSSEHSAHYNTLHTLQHTLFSTHCAHCAHCAHCTLCTLRHLRAVHVLTVPAANHCHSTVCTSQCTLFRALSTLEHSAHTPAHTLQHTLRTLRTQHTLHAPPPPCSTCTHGARGEPLPLNGLHKSVHTIQSTQHTLTRCTRSTLHQSVPLCTLRHLRAVRVLTVPAANHCHSTVCKSHCTLFRALSTL
jgi:hypothetical protein